MQLTSSSRYSVPGPVPGTADAAVARQTQPFSGTNSLVQETGSVVRAPWQQRTGRGVSAGT